MSVMMVRLVVKVRVMGEMRMRVSVVVKTTTLRLPGLGREHVVGGARSNVARKATGRELGLFVGKDAEHVPDEGANLVGLTVLLLVEVLQVGNRVHDLLEALLEDDLLVLELEEQLRDVVEAALAFRAVRGRLQDGFGL